MSTNYRLFLLAVVILFTGGNQIPAAPPAVNFGRDVLPILSDNCFLCHGPDAKTRKAGLRLDTEDGAFRTNDPVIVKGRHQESELIRRITSAEPSKLMPPTKSNRKLTPAQIDALKRWIDEGAKWGRHWAFEPPQRQPLPLVKDRNWARNPIDIFIQARLDAEGLKPSPEADPTTLIRRLSLDLTGLPPTPEEVEQFIQASAAKPQAAYEELVDRLLASPHFGERMVWDWLDAARYADSNGYQGDSERTMWPWRDWAVAAFNRNTPFDQFTVEQIAGDLLPGATTEQKLATGFNRNHMINGEGGRIPEENRVDYVMDMAETAGTVWLGLTFNCCRCHDHKFDPLSQRDYYSLFAFFNQTPINGGGGDPQTKPVLELPSPEQAAKLKETQEQIRTAAAAVAEAEQGLRPLPEADLKPETVAILKTVPEQRNRSQIEQLEKALEKLDPEYVALLKKQRSAIDARDGVSRSVPRVMVMEDTPKSRDTFMLYRGSYQKPTDKVSAAVPTTLPPLPPDVPPNRLALARWLASPDNPLTARVTVNRLWQQLFGTGLVKTAEDFGVQGEKPSHPELLDWLAVEFRDGGWDVKALLRLIATSATYRQSSRVPPALTERDPQNRLLARGPRFRMPSWMLRDQALAASGLLVPKLGGPPVKPYQPPGVWEEATFGGKRYQPDKGEGLYRRSVYTFWRRIIGPTMFFDSAARQVCTVKQARTNTPLHALATLNDVTYVEAARVLAQRLLTSEKSDEQRVELAFRLILARKPRAEEAEVLLAALARTRREFAADPVAAKKLLSVGDSKRDEKLDMVEHAALTAVCSAILNLDEALTKE